MPRPIYCTNEFDQTPSTSKAEIYRVLAHENVKMEAPQARPAVDEILALKEFPHVLWELTPTQSGKLPVAKTRGGPVNIEWEVHGKGDIKLVWIMGLGGVKTNWQRQSLKYGHEEGNKYSSLIADNRGTGGSDKPLMRYSTSEMAKDLIELIDSLGWTEKRQLHVSGVSMGGMIAQELAYLIPTRIASLNLLSTACQIENTIGFIENLRNRINMFIPKSLDRSVTDAAYNMFSDKWLVQPDDCQVPKPGTPGVVFPDSGFYPLFETNFTRWAATELTKRLDPEKFGRKGFVLQAIAAGWHYMSPERLKELGDKVGRERIMILHGDSDNMISVYHGKKLIELLKPEVAVIFEGAGHVFMVEEWRWHNEMIEKQIEKVSKFAR
ncbi:Alpha/Beta hydrolase protein [Calycina marina]|uniref:Alpha/Beta hydrolase protein n=1 Tax=Calycina marina TaxID=1763456 RepID=A0A9P8CCS5_9HELO|nr:Alpha/Beta hydrolase protein [Calycina marina]